MISNNSVLLRHLISQRDSEMNLVRKIIAAPAGIVCGMFVMLLLLIPSFLLYPIPEGMDVEDPVAFSEYVKSLPFSAFLLVLFQHACGPFIAAIVCRIVKGNTAFYETMVIGLFFLICGIINLVQVQHPVWFSAVDITVYIPMAILGNWLVQRSRPTTTAVQPAQE